MPKNQIFRIIFYNDNELFEVYAHQIFQSDLWGFLEIEQFSFGERSQMLVDPSEEKLKSIFNDVKRSYIPITSIVRIDEVEKSGQAKIKLSKNNIRPFIIPKNT